MHSFELENHLKHTLKNEIIICQILRKNGLSNNVLPNIFILL